MFKKLRELVSVGKPTDLRASEVPIVPAGAQSPFSCWSTTQLDNHRVDVFSPQSAAQPQGCVLFLHGHGRVMLNENQAFTQLLNQHQLAAVVPDGKRSWWMNRLCKEFSPEITPQDWLLEKLVPFVEQTWAIQPPAIAVMGVSMGGQGALQLSFRDAKRFPVVAAIAPAVDFDQLYGQDLPLDHLFTDREDARQSTVVLNLHPLSWPRYQWFCCDPEDTDWYHGCVRLGMKLSSSGIQHERDLETTAGGHSWDYFNHMAPAAFKHIVSGLASYRSG